MVQTLLPANCFRASSPYNNPQVPRAQCQALKALECLNERERRQRTLPPNAGKPWTDDEDRLLSEAFDGGASLKDLALKHGRTEGAIAARLVKLGKVSERAEAYDRTRGSGPVNITADS